MSRALRVLVCGGRDYKNVVVVYDQLDTLRRKAPHDAMLVIQGGATGADKLARQWAMDRSVEYQNYPADWATHGRAAGPIRNERMLIAGRPNLVVAFPGGNGTADMVRRVRSAGIEVVEIKDGN